MAEAKARHPAGSRYVPTTHILARLTQVVAENYWMYGTPTPDAPNRVERWDLRSMLDWVIATLETTDKQTYANFYLWRNTAMQLLIQAGNELIGSVDQRMENYGDWRFWETHKDRTQMDIERVIKYALDRSKEKL